MNLRIYVLKKNHLIFTQKNYKKCKICKYTVRNESIFSCESCNEPLFCNLCKKKVKSYKCRLKKS